MTRDNEWTEHATQRTRRWSHVLLLALVAEVFIVPPLLALGVLPRWVAAVGTTVMLLAAAAALGEHRAARSYIIAVALVAVITRWVQHFASGIDAANIANVVITAVAGGAFAGLFLADVFGRGRLPDRLVAVLLAYIFLGATWAQVYHAIELIYPGSLTLPGSVHPASEFVYFSFATLTSVGYGDIVPVNPIVRSLAVLEALTGQLYLVIIVSRFVGAAAVGRDPTQGGGGYR